MIIIQDSHDSTGRAGHKTGPPGKQTGNIRISQAVYIFIGTDTVDDPCSVEVMRQGHHHENTKNIFLLIEMLEHGNDIPFAYRFRQAVNFSRKTYTAGYALHRRRIHSRRLVLTGQYDGQFRPNMLFLEIKNPAFYPLTVKGRHGLAI